MSGRWDAGTCCTPAPQDDIGYLRAVVASVAARTLIDRSRIYVVGFSNGGMRCAVSSVKWPVPSFAQNVTGPA